MNILTYNGSKIQQREKDNYVNLTQMAQANGKRFDNYLQTQNAQEYLKALQESIPLDFKENVKIIEIKGFGKDKSTWGHPLVAIAFAQWISPQFYLWYIQHIQILETGKTEIEPKPKTALGLARKLVTLLESLTGVHLPRKRGECKNP